MMRLGLRGAQQLLASPANWVEILARLVAKTAFQIRDLLVWPFISIRRVLTQTYYHFFGFRYNDIIESNQIRLIRLPKTTQDEHAPNLGIHTFPLSQCPPYLALSYTWGPSLSFEKPYTRWDTAPIRLNGRPFPVLLNLHRALSQLCKSRPDEYLWVDSICINQGSLDERSAQVGIMDLVYNGAVGTLIWLGPETDTTGKALKVLQSLAEGAEEKILKWTSTQTFGDAYIADDPELLARNGLPPLTANDWADLSDIFTRSWFGRVWMLQEVALSTSPTVLIGPHELPWDSIGYTAGILGLSNALCGLLAMRSGPQHVSLIRGVIHAQGLQVMREWSLGGKSQFREFANSHDFSAGINSGHPSSVLLRLLISSNGLKATYRRDRVYALVGIANHVARQKGLPPLSLDIDYHSTDDQVLTSLGFRLFRETQSLHLLSLAGLVSHGPESTMATWIPSFENLHAPLMGPNYSNLRPFNACDASPEHPQNSPGFTIDEESYKLHIQARSPNLGTIEELGETWSEVIGGNFLNCIKILLHCGQSYSFTGEPIVEAFWRTLILDHDAAQRPAPSHLATSFAAWMKLIIIGALYKNRISNPFMFDLFDSLEPLWILGNSRDSTKLLPTTDAMFPLMCSLGLLNNPSIPKMSMSEMKSMTSELGKIAAPYEALVKLALLPNRRLARTVRGYLCLVPWKAEVGDRVMIVAGCPTPLVLRRAKEMEDCYLMVGDAYVHGAMFGEHIRGDGTWRHISLI